jgi:hypothetical protein
MQKRSADGWLSRKDPAFASEPGVIKCLPLLALRIYFCCPGMYLANAPEGKEGCEMIEVDGRVFYRVRSTDDKRPVQRRRRYSDQFKNPLFVQRNINRKLNMMRQFREKENLQILIDRWRECVGECIGILRDECHLDPALIFKSFNLERHGFVPEDYGA